MRIVRTNFMVQWVAVLSCAAALAVPLSAKEKVKDTDKAVDSGSFGVFSGGRRVATETFSIHQGPGGSVVSSEFKSAQGEQSAEQSSELQLTASAELRSYEWKETNPEKNTATVTPNDAFLIERYTVGPQGKEQSQNFLLPASTAILDDYFFVQREILAWKYLATACKKDQGPVQCPMNQKTQFGTLNPHARSSMSVTIEFSGKQKIGIHGVERDLAHFVLRSENGDWAFWLDDQFKLVRLLDDSGTEVVRD